MPDLFVSDKEKIEPTPADPSSTNGHEAIPTTDRTEVLKRSALKYPKDEDEKKHLLGHTSNPLAAFNYFPSQVDFVNKDPDEKVVLFLRKHPITNLKWVVPSFFMIILPPFVSAMSILEFLPGDYLFLAYVSWYMITVAYIFEHFLNWFFSVNIVTDERLFDVDFYHLIYRKITDANIDQIQDVTVQIGGGFRTMFNFGDVIIQTAAEIPEIEFEAVPMPDRVAKILRELRVEEEVEKIEGRVR